MHGLSTRWLLGFIPSARPEYKVAAGVCAVQGALAVVQPTEAEIPEVVTLCGPQHNILTSIIIIKIQKVRSRLTPRPSGAGSVV